MPAGRRSAEISSAAAPKMAGVGNNTDTAGGDRLQDSVRKGENILSGLLNL